VKTRIGGVEDHCSVRHLHENAPTGDFFGFCNSRSEQNGQRARANRQKLSGEPYSPLPF
jgi:hypothetical protein